MARASFHFRNKIIDFDCQDNLILVSCFSDGLDVISIDRDAFNNIKLVPFKGDKISRTCIACLWLNSSAFLISDKNNNIQQCCIHGNIRFIQTTKTFSFNEIIIKLFKFNSRIYCETISGSVIDVSNEIEE